MRFSLAHTPLTHVASAIRGIIRSKGHLGRLMLGVFASALVVAVGCDITVLAPSASASSTRIAVPAVDYASKTASWPMFGNNVYSDCSIAAAGDLMQAWNLESRQPAATLSDSQAVGLFQSMGGSTTQGVAIDAVLGKWLTSGLGGNRIASAGQLNNTSVPVTERAIQLLGGVIAEVYLTPQTQLELTNGQTVTSTAAGSPSLAHALIFIGYNAQYLTAVTFGHIVHVSWAWWLKNGVLEYGVIPQSFGMVGHGPVAGLSADYLTQWLGQQTA